MALALRQLNLIHKKKGAIKFFLLLFFVFKVCFFNPIFENDESNKKNVWNSHANWSNRSLTKFDFAFATLSDVDQGLPQCPSDFLTKGQRCWNFYIMCLSLCTLQECLMSSQYVRVAVVDIKHYREILILVLVGWS